MLKKQELRKKRKFRIRKSVTGTAQKPRLSVFRSNKYIYASLIDDENHVTLASANDVKKSGTKVEKALEVGKDLGKKAKEANIDEIVFDRNGYKYHGRVKSVAEGAREIGLKF